MPVQNVDEQISAVTRREAWCATWVQRGMVCVQTGGKSFETSLTDSGSFDALGCGGWDASGRLHWVGIDLDVGHGNAKNKYETREDAVNAAQKLRRFVGNAAEIRTSKSGAGIHVRIAICGVDTDGRKKAGYIAKWLLKTLAMKGDTSVAVRQNFWFWARNVGFEGFKEIEPCIGAWEPPPIALVEDVPVYVPPPPRTSKPSNVIARAEKYLAKLEPAVSGQGGHNQTFKAACVLVLGFDLSMSDAKALLQGWNAGCQPPWTEKELEHKLRGAASQPGARGYLLQDRPEWNSAPIDPPVMAQTPAELVRRQCVDEIEGRRFAVDWPWTQVTRLTYALLPGTVTVLCAPAGSSKSFLMVQAVAYWRSLGIPCAVLMLEESMIYHTRRALSQFIGNSNIVDFNWVKKNPAAAEAILTDPDNVAFMNGIGESVHTLKGPINTGTVIEWMTAMFASGHRIIAIDPITARDNNNKAWVDDQIFVQAAKRLVDESQASLVLVTHPPKGLSGKQAATTDLGDIAGGAAFGRFSSTVMWLAFMEEKEISYATSMGVASDLVNRRIELRKTRNNRGQGKHIGMYFDPNTLSFFERGILIRG